MTENTQTEKQMYIIGQFFSSGQEVSAERYYGTQKDVAEYIEHIARDVCGEEGDVETTMSDNGIVSLYAEYGDLYYGDFGYIEAIPETLLQISSKKKSDEQIYIIVQFCSKWDDIAFSRVLGTQQKIFEILKDEIDDCFADTSEANTTADEDGTISAYAEDGDAYIYISAVPEKELSV